jgi:RNA polymerase sigma factor (sigma-70 family)
MTPQPRSDAELISASRRDPDAFAEFCGRHAAVLNGWLQKELGDPGLAQELLAETLSEAWLSRRRYRDPGNGEASAWLFGIARNLLRRLYRTRQIERRGRERLGLPVASSDLYADVVERLAAAEDSHRLHAALALLPSEQRDALQLRVIDGLDYVEVSERLSITAEGARTRVFRALGTLRAQLVGRND